MKAILLRPFQQLAPLGLLAASTLLPFQLLQASIHQDRHDEYRPSKISEICKGQLVHRHANGGGYVAATASVSAEVFVGPHAIVCDEAKVSGSVRIDGNSIIGEAADITGKVTVHDSKVLGTAHLMDDVKVVEHSEIKGKARLSGSITARGYKMERGFHAGSHTLQSVDPMAKVYR